ncbi:MAG: hypothetical protein NTX87_05785 [Planctomycetota bacterium]|nr:hypothetical protein [Planctomycetota bacterium]
MADNTSTHTTSCIRLDSPGNRLKMAGKPQGRLERAMGFEPTTFSLGSGEHPDVTLENKKLTTPPPPACTTACTSKPENVHESKPEGTPTALTADALAALVRQLPPEERARLAEMLTGKGETGTVDAR